MHHAKRLLCLMVLTSIFTITNAEAAKDGLVKVERPECLNFPKILEFSKAVKGVHYVEGTDTDCDEDYENCTTYSTLKTKYVYTSVKSYDYYSSEGKLITSETLKTAHSIDDSKYSSSHASTESMWNELAGELRAKISLELYQHENGACETSFYKE